MTYHQHNIHQGFDSLEKEYEEPFLISWKTNLIAANTNNPHTKAQANETM